MARKGTIKNMGKVQREMSEARKARAAEKRGAEGTYKLLVVKRILPAHGASRRFRSMFVEEAQLATRLNHPNVVQVYELFDAGEEGQKDEEEVKLFHSRFPRHRGIVAA